MRNYAFVAVFVNNIFPGSAWNHREKTGNTSVGITSLPVQIFSHGTPSNLQTNILTTQPQSSVTSKKDNLSSNNALKIQPQLSVV
jgi:hypothetical protein